MAVSPSSLRSRVVLKNCTLFRIGRLACKEYLIKVLTDELCFVKQRENQIVVTIGALLHYIYVEL